MESCRGCVQRTAGMTVLALLAGSCHPGDGSPRPDATPDGHAVRGRAVGVLEPVSLALVHPGGTETRLVAGDGPFAFETRLEQGQPYEARLEGAPACVLENARGTIDSAASELVLACAGAPLLTSLTLSGPTAPDLRVSLAQTEYEAEVSLLQQTVTLTPVALRPEAIITMAGTPVASGSASPELPLALGANDIDIVVAHPSGRRQRYHLIIHRAAALAQYAYGKASNTGASDYFGYSVALWGDTLAVGAPGEASAATGVNGNQDDDSADASGAVYVFRRTDSAWAQEAYLKASNTGANDWFGASVALSGDTLAVGASVEDSAATGVNGNQDDNSAAASGAVYVFRRTGSAWAQEAYLKASNTGADDELGASVALSGDTLAVGAPFEASAATGVGGNQDDNSAAASGAVYVFRRTGSAWAQEAYLKASNTGADDELGWSVALSGDTLAVGAPFEASAATGVGGNQDDDSAFGSGAVYVFRRTGSAWAQEAYVKASNTGVEYSFGLSVALSGDTLAAGAPFEASAATGVGGDQDDDSALASGAVYVFRRMGSAWAQEAYLKASNTGANDEFGSSVALSGDTLAVGAPFEASAATGVGGDQDDDSAGKSGAVYLFRRAGETWAQEAYVKASNTGANDELGWSVALSADTLAAGAFWEDSAATGVNGNQDDDSASNSGAVYVFH